MIKFFRKIRQKLLSENKFSKYLIYAIGEILLVMIGILLALQVNNWNEERKRDEKEKNILAEIRRDIDETNSEIVRDMTYHLQMLVSAQGLKDLLNKDKPDIEMVNKYYLDLSHDLQVYPKTNGFEILKSQGLEIIDNDSLRTNISNLYQLHYTRLTNFGRLTPESSIIEIFLPYTLKHFRISGKNTQQVELKEFDLSTTHDKIEVKNIDNLKNDEEFLIILEKSMQLRRYKIALHKTALEYGVQVLDFINNEQKTTHILINKEKINLTKILLGKWKSEQFPNIIVSFYMENEELYVTTNIEETNAKCIILSDSRLYSYKGNYIKIQNYQNEYKIESNGTTWRKVKE